MVMMPLLMSGGGLFERRGEACCLEAAGGLISAQQEFA